MDHDSAVANSPTGAACDLFSDMAVFKTQNVVGEWGFVEEMAKFAAKIGIIFIPDLEYAIVDPEGIAEIFAQRITANFWGPAV